jgi:hypothetical protein
MAAQDLERLVVQLSADVRGYQNAINKAQGITNARAKQIENRFQTMGSKVSASFKGMAAGLAAGIAAGGIGGLVAGFAEATKSVAELGDAAKVAGVSSKAFQEWRYVAEQARIPIDAITDGLKEMSLRADEFAATGKGSAAEAFGRLGLTPQEVKERLKDPSEFLLLLIDRTKQLNDTAAGVRIFDELFGGTGGERMVSLLSQGEKGIREQIKAANDLGLVIDDALIRRAAELDAKFNTIVSTVGQNLKGAIVSASDSLVDFIDRWREVENQSAATLTGRQAEVDTKRLELETKILEVQNNQVLSQEKRNKAAGQYRIELEKLNAESAQIAGALNGKLPAVSKVTDRTFTPIPPTEPKADAARAKAAREADKERRAVTELIAELDFEYSLIGKSRLEQEKLTAVRQAGSAATAAEKAAIESKIEAIDRETNAVDKARDAAANAAEAARDFAGTLVDGFVQGESAAQALGNALKNLGNRLFNAGLDSLFSTKDGSVGLFGALFRKDGGPVELANGGSVRGPGGPRGDKIPAMLSDGEYVVNAAATKRNRGMLEAINSGSTLRLAKGGFVGSAPTLPKMSSAAKSQSFALNFAPVLNAQGADKAEVAAMRRDLATMRAELPSQVVRTVKDAQKRRII